MATSPFRVLFDTAAKLEGVADKGLFLDVLTLDDWVHTHRLIIAMDVQDVEDLNQLRQLAEDTGIYPLCRSIAQRMVNQEFTDDPGTRLKEARDRVFNLTAFLQVGLMNALRPALFVDTSL